MKAMVYDHYGSPDVLELREIEKPTPKDDEVLIKVHAASVNAIEYRFLLGTPFLARIVAGGLRQPKRKVLGVDVAGRVEAVGVGFKQFQPGDEVFGLSFMNGAFAEYFCAPEAQIQMVLKAESMSFEEAAAIPCSASTALTCLRDFGQIKPDQSVLINGASGAVGTFAVQIAKSYGTEVTGVCSTRNLDMVRSIGADHAIDYTQEDFAQYQGQYDLIYDAVRKRSFSDCRRALSPQGIYVTTGWSPGLELQARWVSMTGSQKMVPMNPMGRPDEKDMLQLKELFEAGKLTPLIDRRYPLSELPDALRHYGTGHARGKIVITI
ncbi:MAG: zinc-binding dehydrogenase [Anaerolineales bacterium]|nr:zinc-binding dehydrogenase [Anaerolineales bacterium]